VYQLRSVFTHAAERWRGSCSCGAGRWIMYRSKMGPEDTIEHVYDQLDWTDVNNSGFGTRVRYYKRTGAQ